MAGSYLQEAPVALDVHADAPAGDVVTAIMDIDSMLRRVHGTAAGQQAEPDARLVVPTAGDAREVLDGYCTVIYLFITWLRQGFEQVGKDPLAEIIPAMVSRLQMMPRNVPPAV